MLPNIKKATVCVWWRDAQPLGMLKFIKLNSSKLKAAFFWSSLIFTSIAATILIVGFFKNQIPEIDLLIAIILGSSLGMPLFIVIIGTVRGTWDLNKRTNAFNTYPFSELIKHGFEPTLKYRATKWQFSEPMLVGNLNGYQIQAEVDTNSAPDVIRFQALTQIALDRANNKDFMPELKNMAVEFDFHGLSKLVSTKDRSMSSPTVLIRTLTAFTDYIREKGFKPMAEHNIV